jgi:DNA-binding transcriptional LysR family regulator
MVMPIINEIMFFIKAFELGSLSETAVYYNLRQSTLSKYINKLEKLMGCQLIKFYNGKVNLTHDGELLYEIFKDTQYTLDELLTSFKHGKLLNNEKISISIPYAMESKCLVAACRQYMKKTKSCVRIRCINHQIDLVRDKIDVGIVYQMPKNHDAQIKRLCSSKIKLACSKKYSIKNGYPDNFDELQNHNLISYDFPNLKKTKVFNLMGEELDYELNARSQICVDNARVGLNLIKENYAVGFVLENDIKNDDELVHLLPDYYFGELSCYLTWDKSNKKVIPFIRYIEDFIITNNL